MPAVPTFRAAIRAVRSLLAAVLLTGAGVLAQAQSTDQSQLLNMYNGLSPEQRQALMQQAGGAAGTSPGAQAAGASGANRNLPDTLNRQRVDRGAEAAADADRLLPSWLQPLRPFDTVLVEVDFADEAPLTTAQQLPTPVDANNIGVAPAAPVANAQQQQQQQQQAARQRSAKARAEEEELSDSERERLKKLIGQLRERNPYTLDASGQLLLPGYAPIALAGLAEELATRRVAAEPSLLKLKVRLTRLPLAKSGVAALKPFGYDFFADGPSTFAPMVDAPVPADYVVGPGDEFSVQLYGGQNRTLRLSVQRDGRLNLPEIGPIEAAGRSYSAVRADIEARVARQMIGTRAAISMGEARAIRIFVMGEAKYPGSYTVSGLATVTGALFAAGGIKAIGSLRDIRVMRSGKLIRHVDLYDLLLNGDTSNDISLLSGDVILIPPVGETVTIDGEVRRPAVYELRNRIGAAAAIALAGGFTPDADTARGSLTRVDDRRQRVVLDVDPARSGADSPVLRNADVLRVARLRPTLDSGVSLGGEVFRAGDFAWREGLRLSDVLGSVNELRPGADQHYLLIRRETGANRHVTAMSADLTAALGSPGGAADVSLLPRDRIMVFDLGATRDRLVKPLITELKLQAGPGSPAQVVTVSGRVKAAGEYPLDTDMHVADLIRAGGGLEDAAYSGKAELSRYVVENGQVRRAQVLEHRSGGRAGR